MSSPIEQKTLTIHSDHAPDLVQESLNRRTSKMLIGLILVCLDLMQLPIVNIVYFVLFFFCLFFYFFSFFFLLAFDKVASACALRVRDACSMYHNLKQHAV